MGNPTTYRNKTLSWSHARQLDSFDTHTFKYNANGIRIQKDNIKFFLNGNKIISQTDGTDTLFFYYGTDGITGFNHNGTDYFYKKNIQGDIIGIYDSTNTLICKYIYDAWGNHVCRILSNNGEYVDIADTSNYNINSNYITIANLNPFRYRSYYYDTETGLYYLNSRYYDSQTGRFINADDISIIDISQITINGLNLYSYCLNNPVNQIDENGYIVGWLLAIIVGSIIGATVNTGFEVANQVKNHGWDLENWNWTQIGLSFLGGAVSGAISAIPVPGFQTFGIWGKVFHYGLTFVIGGIGAVAGGLIDGSVYNIKSAFTNFAIGGTFSLFADLFTNGLNNIVQKYSNNVLTNPLYANMTLEDLIGSGLKEYPKHLAKLMNKLSRAILYANRGLTKSIFYMIGINSILEIISGLL